jgi:hypothetical protein
MLSNRCHSLNKFACNPHKTGIFSAFQIIRTQCRPSGTKHICIVNLFPRDSICVLVPCVSRVSELLFSKCYQQYVISLKLFLISLLKNIISNCRTHIQSIMDQSF